MGIVGAAEQQRTEPGKQPARSRSKMPDSKEIEEFVNGMQTAFGKHACAGDVDGLKKAISEYCTDGDVGFIRPSGNPISWTDFAEKMLGGGDIKFTKWGLESFISCRFICGGNGAVVTYSIVQNFDYKGNKNED